MNESAERWRRWGELVVRSWEDEGVRRRMLNEPEALLKEIGVSIPAGMKVRVVADPAEAESVKDDTTLVLPLPPPPPPEARGRSAIELTEQELERLSGGGTGGAMSHGSYLSTTIAPLRVPSHWAGAALP